MVHPREQQLPGRGVQALALGCCPPGRAPPCAAQPGLVPDMKASSVRQAPFLPALRGGRGRREAPGPAGEAPAQRRSRGRVMPGAGLAGSQRPLLPAGRGRRDPGKGQLQGRGGAASTAQGGPGTGTGTGTALTGRERDGGGGRAVPGAGAGAEGAGAARPGGPPAARGSRGESGPGRAGPGASGAHLPAGGRSAGDSSLCRPSASVQPGAAELAGRSGSARGREGEPLKKKNILFFIILPLGLFSPRESHL